MIFYLKILKKFSLFLKTNDFIFKNFRDRLNKWDPKYTHQLEGKKEKRGGTHEQIAHLPIVFIHASKKVIKGQFKSLNWTIQTPTHN